MKLERATVFIDDAGESCGAADVQRITGEDELAARADAAEGALRSRAQRRSGTKEHARTRIRNVIST